MPIRFGKVRIQPGIPADYTGPKNIKNVVQVVTKKNGSVYGRNWPRKKSKKKSELQKLLSAQWLQAVEWSKWPTPEEYARAVEMTAGKLYVPRDILIRAMYGKLISFTTTDGQVWVSRRDGMIAIQTYLDQITDIPGALLVRDADQWVGLLPGTAGRVLQTNGPGALPTWAPNGGGGGGGKVHYAQNIAGAVTNTSGGAATIYRPFWAQAGSIVYGSAFLPRQTFPTRRFASALYADGDGNANAPGALVASMAESVAGMTAGQILELPFDVPYLVPEPGIYWTAISADGQFTASADVATDVYHSGTGLPWATTAPTVTKAYNEHSTLIASYGDLIIS